MVFSGVSSRIKRGEENIQRSQYTSKCKLILATICPCQRFYCSTLRVQQQSIVDTVTGSFLREPVAKHFHLLCSYERQLVSQTTD